MLTKALSQCKKIWNVENLSLLILFLLGAFAVPFAGVYSTLIGSLLVYGAFSYLLLNLYKKNKKSEHSHHKSIIFKFIPLFVFLAFLSTLLNGNLWYAFFVGGSFESTMFFWFLLLVLFVYTVRFAKDDFFDKLATLIKISFWVNFVFLALTIIMQKYIIPAYNGSSGAPILSPLDFAFLSALTIVLSLFSLESKSKTYRIVNIVNIFAAIVAIAVLNVYQAWYFLAISSLAVIVFYKRGLKTPYFISVVKSLKTLMAVIVLLISLLFILFGGTLSTAVNNLTKVQFQELRPTLAGDMQVLSNEYKSVKNTLFGTGAASHEFAWTSYQSNPNLALSPFWDSTFVKAANFVTRIAVEFGILGLALYVYLILAYLYYLMKLIFTPAFAKKIDIGTGKLFVLLGLVMLTTVFYDPGAPLLVISALILAVFVSRLTEKGILRESKCVIAKLPLLSKFKKYKPLLLLPLVLYMFIATLSVTLNTAYYQLTQGFGADQDARYSYLTRLALLGPAKDSLYVLQASMLDRQILDEYGKLLKAPEDKKDELKNRVLELMDKNISKLRKAGKYNNRNYKLYLRLADSYKNRFLISGDKQDLQNASVYVKRAMSLAPFNPQVEYMRANIAFAQKDDKKAKESLLRALAIKPNYSPAYDMLYNLAALNKNLQEAYDIALSEYKATRNPQALKKLIYVLYNAKKYKEAESYAALLVRQVPDADAYYLYALVLNAEGKKQEALKILRALAKQVKNPAILRTIEEIEKGDKNTEQENSDKENKSDSDKKDGDKAE